MNPLPSTVTDRSDEFAAAIATLATQTQGTLHLPDGTHGISRPLRLPWNVSLKLAPSATLVALPGFSGDALIIKDAGPKGTHLCYGVIQGGTIDARGLPITGIRVEHACRLLISDMEVRNATLKGIHVGVTGWYECNVAHVRISLEMDMRSSPGSIGLHYERATDSMANTVVIIGYETGMRSDSSSNDFHQVHVWNVPAQGPLIQCFHCNGWNDSYNQCYADSPFNGDEPCYGFLVTVPFQRIIAGRVYCNDFVPDNKAIGIHIKQGATHGTYFANHFTARDGHRIAAAIAGDLDSACVMGNSYSSTVITGRVCQVPSGGGGISAMPVMNLVAEGRSHSLPCP